ncbi:MAG: TetR/AcrR family transcriptional regulator [Polyangiaceae bacterium]
MTAKRRAPEAAAKRRSSASGGRSKSPAPPNLDEDEDVPASEEAERKDRIIDVAIRLAEEGGFDNVRQRDVARQAGVALGTLYKSFRGKDDILAAALYRETDALEQRMKRRPVTGEDAADRLGSLFQMLTKAILRKPNYARAVLKAMTSGEEVAGKVVSHQIKVTRMVLAAMRGAPPDEPGSEPPTHDEIAVAMLLQNIWFGALVGWNAGLFGQSGVVDQVRQAAELLLAGAAARGREDAVATKPQKKPARGKKSPK